MKKVISESQLRAIIAESVKRILNERAYDSLSREELKHLVILLKQKPLQDMWKPINYGFCMVQRVEAHEMSGHCYLLNTNDDGTEDLYVEEGNGITMIQIERRPNVHRLEESGYTYMAWKA